MDNFNTMYDFLSDTWRYVKNTTAPEQSDNNGWEQIIDHSNELCREFTKMMAGWMEYLRKESLK